MHNGMGRLTAASLDNYWLLVPYDSKNEADLISDHIFPSPFTKNRDQYIKQVNSLFSFKYMEGGWERERESMKDYNHLRLIRLFKWALNKGTKYFKLSTAS